jgi:hypothetical protein
LTFLPAILIPFAWAVFGYDMLCRSRCRLCHAGFHLFRGRSSIERAVTPYPATSLTGIADRRILA